MADIFTLRQNPISVRWNPSAWLSIEPLQNAGCMRLFLMTRMGFESWLMIEHDEESMQHWLAVLNPLIIIHCICCTAQNLVDPNPKCMKMSRIQSEVHHHFCPKWVQWQDGVGRNWSQHSRRTGQRRANCGCRHTRPRLHKGGWASVAAENSPVVPISCQTHQSDPCLPNNWKVRVPEPWQLEMTWTCGKSEYLHLQWHGWRQFLEQFSTIYPAKSCKVQVWIT